MMIAGPLLKSFMRKNHSAYKSTTGHNYSLLQQTEEEENSNAAMDSVYRITASGRQ